MASTTVPAGGLETTAPDPDVVHGGHGYDTNTGISNTKLAMWLFLASECLLFGGLITTYLLYRLPAPGTGVAPHELFDIPFTSITSFVLLMSSLTMVLAVTALEEGHESPFRRRPYSRLFEADKGQLSRAERMISRTVPGQRGCPGSPVGR